MRTSDAKCLVIDADIIHRAGGRSDAHSAEFLSAVYEICHRAALSSELWDEWQRHPSESVRQWRRRMYGRKKLVRVHAPPLPGLAAAVESTVGLVHDTESAYGVRMALLKDRHLVETALAADGIVVSGEKRARGHFARMSRHLPVLQDLVWVNPKRADEHVVAWLDCGAPFEPGRTLAAYLESLEAG